MNEQASHDAPASVPTAHSRGTETVLVVEDEPIVRALVCQTLGERGYRVLDAEGGSQAMAVAARHIGPLELLVTDVVMPGMSGLELARHMCDRRPLLKVLYISGYSDETVAAQRMPLAGGGFLQKPFTLDMFARKVREVLDAPGTAPVE